MLSLKISRGIAEDRLFFSRYLPMILLEKDGAEESIIDLNVPDILLCLASPSLPLRDTVMGKLHGLKGHGVTVRPQIRSRPFCGECLNEIPPPFIFAGKIY